MAFNDGKNNSDRMYDIKQFIQDVYGALFVLNLWLFYCDSTETMIVAELVITEQIFQTVVNPGLIYSLVAD